jgi:thiamine biosynthesis lipoprotein
MSDQPRFARTEHVMGMPVTVSVCDAQLHPSHVERVYQWLRFVDETFSTYRPDSQISALNRGELALADAHSGVRSVLARCERLREQTGGYFDARVRASQLPPSGEVPGDGPALDPSGLVKGWAVAGAASLLDRAGLKAFCVDAGGDVFVRGHPDGAAAWRVGIQHPRRRDAVAAVLALSDAGVATSGAYERGTHIRDPHSGATPTGVLSVTIVDADIATADAYATAVYAMGPAGADWCARQFDLAAMVILADDTVSSTTAMRQYRVAG